MVRRPSAWVVAILLGIFGGLRGPSPARGDDGPARDPDGPLLLQYFEVGALTRGTTRFLGEKGPEPARTDMVNDEEAPLFGGEGEETLKPYGTVEELIDVIRASTSPRAWESTEGFSIAPLGTRRLMVRATKPMIDSVGAFLLELEREATRTVTLDVVALRGDAMAAGPEDLAGAIARGALVPLTGARTVAVPGQQVAGRRGGHFTYMQDYDVEVASDSKGPDPVVGVVHDGLSYVATVLDASPTKVRVTIRGWWAGTSPIRSSRTADGESLETFDTEGRTLSATLDLVPGAWMLVPSSGGVSFAVRAASRTCDVAPLTVGPLSSRDASTPQGALARHRWPISDLVERTADTRGTEIRLPPSNFTPPEPPELPEPFPAFPAETLTETLRLLLGPDVASREGVSLDVRNGHLWANLDSASAQQVEAALAELRARFLKTTRLKATVLSLPVAAFPEYFAGLDDGAALLADGGEGLLRRPGATVLDRTGLRVRSSHRTASVGGSRHAYVADFDVEIAEKSFIGNPILHTWLEGTSFDVVAEPTADGAGVWCELRFDRSVSRGTRSVSTRFGALELPSVGLERIRGSFALPLGATRIVGASIEDGRVTLVLVSANGE